MGILTRYIVAEILRILFPIWFALGFLMFVLEWLAQVFRVNAPASTVLLLYAYKIPTHLQLVFPVAVLVSTLIVLSAMNRQREIVAAQSMSVPAVKLLVPTLLALSIAGVVNYWVMNVMSPWGMRKHYELVDREIDRVPSRFSQIRQEKIWYRNRDILYNVGFFQTEKNELYDVTIYTFDEDFHIAQTIYATKATWTGSNWILSNGTISLTDKRLETPVAEPFKTRSTKLIEEPKALKRVEFNADTMTQSELDRAIQRSHALGINTAKWEVTYQSRYSFFLIAFVFSMLAFPMSLRFRRSPGFAKDGVVVAVLSMVYWMIFNFTVNLGNVGKIHPIIAAWAPSILFLGVAIFYINTRGLRALSD